MTIDFRFIKNHFLCLLFIIFFCHAAAQQRYKPFRITGELKLDGALNEPEWKSAMPITDFIQVDPYPGTLPSERTEVRMLYNDAYLYVGFHCYDKEPDKIVRFLMDRDFELGKDDGISVQLDTYNDKNTAVLFITNTLSARFDSEISSNGANSNNNYNNFWDAVSVNDSTGYTAEFRIPFSSLRFEQKEKTVMGFRFARLIKRKNELLTYPKCDSSIQNQWKNVSQEAELEFSNLQTKKPIYLIPYVIANFEKQNMLNGYSTAYESSNVFLKRKLYSSNETVDKIISNIGADLKYGISKNFTLNATINTDFAQAEVDNRIINLSKYVINLPEKRSFFLESQSLLSYSVGQYTQLFNSRRIGLEDGQAVPIIGGLRITGKQNGWAIGALNMQTSDVNDKEIPAQNFSVFRWRKYYDSKGSFWGGILTNRFSTGNNLVSNQSYGVGAVNNINDKWTVGFGTAVTYDSLVNKSFDKNSFINVFIYKNVNEGFSHGINFEHAGEKFNPAMGFNPETDYGFISITNGKRTRLSGIHSINYWSVNTELQYRWKLLSQLTETRFANIKTELNWKNGSILTLIPAEYKEDRLFESWQISDNVLIPAGYYHMFTGILDYIYDESKSYTGEFLVKYGDFYGGTIFTLNPSADYIINRYFRLNINYEYNQINFPMEFSESLNPIYRSNLVALNLTVTQSSKFSIKLLAQYDDNSNSLGGNLRIRYNPKEGTDLYIVFNSALNVNRLDVKPKIPLFDQQAIVVKYSIAFGL